MANNNDKFISRENAKTLWGYMIDLLTGKQNKLTFDDTPTQSSDNPVKSGGIFTALAGKGTYSKPQNGIPKTDLENAVQTSLGLADSALQSETDPTVPSWAKQTNKPSYTQDEVGDGTTYKRVSSTEKDTWNAKGTYSKPSGGIPKSDLASAVQTSLEKADSALQSYTETDPTVPSWAKQSSKPSYNSDEISDTNGTHKFATQAQLNQISTNQTNILSVSDANGQKNILDLQAPLKIQSVTASNLSNGSVKLDLSNATWTSYNVDADTVQNETYKFIVYVEATSGLSQFNIYIRANDANGANVSEFPAGIPNAQVNSVGTHIFEFVATASKMWFGIYPNNQATSVTGSVTLHVMLCKKSLYDASPTYQPYSLPNTAITPELIELCDSGAKNLLNDTDWMNNVTVTKGTKSVNNGAITLTSTAADCYTGFQSNVYPIANRIPVTAGETVVLSWKYTAGSGQTNDNVYVFPEGSTVDSKSVLASVGYLVYTVPSGKTYLTFRLGVISSGKSATWSNIMCCKLAAWNVSHKYVPYRPNWDLVERKPYEIAVISDSDLNNLADGTFTFSSQNQIAGISAGAWCVIRTYYLNAAASRKMQIIESQYGDRKTRFYNGTWGSWG